MNQRRPTSYGQSKDFMESICELFTRLSRCLQILKSRVEDSRVNMLAEHLQRHERRVRELVERTRSGASEKVRETWLQYAPDVEPPDLDELNTTDPSVEEIVEKSLAVEDYAVESVSKLAGSAQTKEGQELLGNLHELLEQNRRNLARGIDQLGDL